MLRIQKQKSTSVLQKCFFAFEKEAYAFAVS